MQASSGGLVEGKTPGNGGMVRSRSADLVAWQRMGCCVRRSARNGCGLQQGGGWQGSLVVLRRDGLVVRLVVSKRQVRAWLASLCVEEVGMGKKEWVWLLIAAALFVTWLVVVGASALSALQHAL